MILLVDDKKAPLQVFLKKLIVEKDMAGEANTNDYSTEFNFATNNYICCYSTIFNSYFNNVSIYTKIL